MTLPALESLIAASAPIRRVQLGETLTGEEMDLLAPMAVQFIETFVAAAPTIVAILEALHESHARVSSALTKPLPPIVDPYKDMESDPGVVGNQPGQDNTLVPTGHGTFRWANRQDLEKMKEHHIAKSRAYARDQWARAKANPLSAKEPTGENNS